MVVSTIIVLLTIVSVPVSPAVVDIGSPSSIVTLQSSKAPVIEPIDLNQATLDELQEVPGIGPALAQRIVDFREEHGPFERLDDLLNVRGIGVRTLEKLKPYLKVDKPKRLAA